MHLNDTGDEIRVSRPGWVTQQGRFRRRRACIVETTNFIADKWGTHTGIDSSEQKHLVEAFSDCQTMACTCMRKLPITDPVYLAEPVTFQHRWRKLADRPVIQAPCTMEAARLYLEAGYNQDEE